MVSCLEVNPVTDVLVSKPKYFTKNNDILCFRINFQLVIMLLYIFILFVVLVLFCFIFIFISLTIIGEVVRLLETDGDFLVRETVRNDEKQIVLSVIIGILLLVQE